MKSAGIPRLLPRTWEVNDLAANHLGWQQRDMFSRFLAFEPSGLLGPVQVTEEKNQSV